MMCMRRSIERGLGGKRWGGENRRKERSEIKAQWSKKANKQIFHINGESWTRIKRKERKKKTLHLHLHIVAWDIAPSHAPASTCLFSLGVLDYYFFLFYPWEGVSSKFYFFSPSCFTNMRKRKPEEERVCVRWKGNLPFSFTLGLPSLFLSEWLPFLFLYIHACKNMHSTHTYTHTHIWFQSRGTSKNTSMTYESIGGLKE